MPKIRVEIEVPSKSCLYCKFFDVLKGRCDIFGSLVKESPDEQHFIIEHCDKCKQAEVKDE